MQSNIKRDDIVGARVRILLEDDPLDYSEGKVIDAKPWAQNGVSWRYLVDIDSPAALDSTKKWCWRHNLVVLIPPMRR